MRLLKLHAKSAPVKKSPPKYSDVFGQWLCDEAAQDDRLLAITPAMCEGSGMVQFANSNTLNVSLMSRLLNNMQ